MHDEENHRPAPSDQPPSSDGPGTAAEPHTDAPEQPDEAESLLDLNEVMRAFGIERWKNLGPLDEFGEALALIVGVEGERLVVIHTRIAKTPEQLRRALTEAGLPPLWIPSPDSFVEVEELPILGTGKLDLRAVKAKAVAQVS